MSGIPRLLYQTQKAYFKLLFQLNTYALFMHQSSTIIASKEL